MTERGEPDATGRPGPRRSGSDVAAIVGLLAVGVVVPLILGALSGSILIPHNDDASIRRTALAMYEGRGLEFNGWTSMTLVSQLLFVQPFLWASGGGPWGFAASTIVFAIVGIVAGYALVRRVLPVRRAFLAVLLVLVFPGFLLHTTSFMTDVPAWAASFACLAVGAGALERDGAARWRWLVGSLVIGCIAFGIREFMVAAPIAVLAAALASDRPHARRYVVAGVVVVAVCAAIYLVARAAPGQHEPPLTVLTERSLLGVVRGFATLALMISPAVIPGVAAWWRRWRRPDLLAGAVVAALVYGPLVVGSLAGGGRLRLIVGNSIEPTGVLGIGALAGGRPVLFRAPTWDLLNLGALLAAVLLLIVLGGALGGFVRAAIADVRAGPGDRWRVLERLGSTRGMLAVFAAGYGLGMGLWGLVVITFDRYLWLLVLPLATLFLAAPPALGRREESPPRAASRARSSVPAWIASAALMIGIAAVSAALLLNAHAFETARWRMGEQAVALGFAPDEVDAGFEWVTFHATGTATPYATGPAHLSRYVAWWPSSRACAMASTSPLNGPAFELLVADEAAYRRFLVAGRREPLYLYRVTGDGCP